MINVSNVNSKQSITSKASTYNAVSIKINEPRVNVNKNINNDENLYNAVNMEINHPSIENKEDCKYCPTYDYPNHNDAITTEFAPIHPITVPSLPLPSAAYQTAGFIDSIFILESDKNEDINKNDTNNSTFNNVNNKIEEEAISVPEPNFTNIENEKSPISLNFKGLNFKSGVHSNLEIIPPEEIKPEINVNEIVENLSSTDFDKQALQMEAIAKIAMNDPEKAIPYIVTEIFTELINIAQKDTSNLKSPSEKQMEIREQIIINEIVKEQAKSEGKDIKEIGLPFDIDKKDLEDAIKLSPMELAERNKEYALYSMAILGKVFVDEVEKHTGNIVPLVELPGANEIVETLKKTTNSGLKIAAIDSLIYINRPEYKDDISTILKIVTNDTNPYVAQTAEEALEKIQ